MGNQPRGRPGPRPLPEARGDTSPTSRPGPAATGPGRPRNRDLTARSVVRTVGLLTGLQPSAQVNPYQAAEDPSGGRELPPAPTIHKRSVELFLGCPLCGEHYVTSGRDLGVGGFLL